MTMIAGWTPKKLTELADYINGYAFKPDDWGKEGLPIIRIEQLKNPDAPTDYFDGELPPATIIEDGDLIFSWSASLFLKIWRHGRAALNQHLFKVIEREGVDRAFLKAFIEYHLPSLTAASHGSTMQHITRKELHRFAAPCPDDKFEQTKIAEILSTVDQAVEQTGTLIAKQQRIKAGLMHDLFTRGIDEDGNLRSEKTHPFKDSPLGRMPVEWETSELRTYLSYLSYGFTNPMPSASDGPYMVTAANVSDGVVQYDECRRTTEEAFKNRLTNKSRPEIGDILITKDGTLGRMAIVDRVPLCINQSVAVLRPKKTVDNRYLKLLLESPLYQKRILDDAGGSTIKHIYISKIDKMVIGVPKKMSEQIAIRERLESHLKQLYQTEILSRKLRSVRTALMQDLLTGKKRVTTLLASEPKREKMYG
jgi:type I restriction enzyme S subunit